MIVWDCHGDRNEFDMAPPSVSSVKVFYHQMIERGPMALKVGAIRRYLPSLGSQDSHLPCSQDKNN